MNGPDSSRSAHSSQRPAAAPFRPAPLRLRPLFKERVWGGRQLAEFGFELPDHGTIGEAWLLADLPDSIAEGRSVVDDGEFVGETLRAVLKQQPRALLGEASLSPEGGFPLLVKLLDAREHLSVQVHPTPAHARRRPGALVKDETWIVLHAEPGAVIYKGLRPGLGRDEFLRAVAEGTLTEHLVAVPVSAGDVHHLPSGLCHALGAGTLVAEVQTPSDTTFRVYDWGRIGRELHLEHAVDCIFGDGADSENSTNAGDSNAARWIESESFRTRRLGSTPNYRIERIETRAGAVRRAAMSVVTDNLPVVLLPIVGGGLLAGGNEVRGLRRGWATLLPAALRGWELELEPGTTLLRIEVPGPRRIATTETQASPASAGASERTT